MIIGLIAVVAVIFGPGFFHLARLTWQAHVLARQLRHIEVVRQELRAEHERLRNDPVYVEGLIRSTFKVSKKGELVVPLESEELANKPR